MSTSSRVALGAEPDRLVGLQLTHSGRWSRPDGAPQPRIAYAHPFLDERVGTGPLVAHRRSSSTSSSATSSPRRSLARRGRLRLRRREALPRLSPARAAERAYDRPGPYGGDLAGRTRFLRHGRRPGSGRRAPGSRSRCGCRRSTSCRSRRRRRRRRCPKPTRAVSAMRSAATAPAPASTSPRPHALLDLAAPSSASGSCASPRAARTTTRTCSGPRTSRRRTATTRRRTRSSASLGARGDRRDHARGIRTSWSSAPATRTCRSGCRTWPQAVVAGGGADVDRPRPHGAVATRRSPADVLAGRPLDRRGICAARSATARPRRATGWCRAATRSTSSTRRAPNGVELPGQAGLMRTITGMAAVLLPFDDAGENRCV